METFLLSLLQPARKIAPRASANGKIARITSAFLSQYGPRPAAVPNRPGSVPRTGPQLHPHWAETSWRPERDAPWRNAPPIQLRTSRLPPGRIPETRLPFAAG